MWLLLADPKSLTCFKREPRGHAAAIPQPPNPDITQGVASDVITHGHAMSFFHDATHVSASAVLFSLNWSKILFDLVADICLGSHSTWCNFKTWMVILAFFTKIHRLFTKWSKKTVFSFRLDPTEISLSQNRQWTKWSRIKKINWKCSCGSRTQRVDQIPSVFWASARFVRNVKR